MLILRVGTSIQGRDKSSKEFKKPNRYVKGEDLSLIPELSVPDLFGESGVIGILNWNNEHYRDTLYKYLEEIQNSKNIFVIDEYEMLDATFKKLSKFATKVFDVREVSNKKSAVNSFTLVDLILAKKKKEAWIEFINVREILSIEEILGALIYKAKMSRNSDIIYFALNSWARMHDSRADGYSELEKFILKM